MAVPEYDPHRLHKTWREKHGLSDKAKDRRDATNRSHKRNRKVALDGKINWDSYQHDQLYDMIMSAKPVDMAEQSHGWRTLAQAIEKTTDDVQTELKKLMDSWHGTAAVSASGATTRLMRWAGDASHTATQIAAGIADYTDAVSLAQRKMPEPGFADAERNFRNGYTVVGTGGPSTAILIQQLLSDQLVSHKEAEDRKAEAVRVMNDYESGSRQAHNDLPDGFEPSPQTTNQNVAADEAHDSTPIVPTGNPRPVDNPAPTPRPVGIGSGVAGDLDGDGIVDSTTPDSFVPSSTAPGPGFSTTGGLPGGGGLGAGGAGGFGGGAGGLGAGGAGSGGAGGFGPLAARGGGVNPGLAGLAGARGAGGLGGSGGLLPGMAGGGARGDDDGEHTNKYDEGLDLFDDLPPAYPPVFGA